ncbi:Methyltransferase domain protein [Planctomycetes bacterium Poly30]|uniref:Methyltransferase domain protein n=1 Tax=Saltatorellus ferox TaxID=2528018 RepID=A0A518EM09_9BACT|nr:Methyltransferase domain protein [Planctomycetes bacterium Poly30]
MPTIQWNNLWRDQMVTWNKEEAYGNQWGDPDKLDILASVRERFIEPFVTASKTALEIGSGGGRWTQYLLGFHRTICVDIHREMFHYLIERFGAIPQLSFCQSDGTGFPGVPARSVDYVFTFGTFVHLDPPLIEGYLNNLRSVLAPGANVVIQYADKDKPMAAENSGFAMTTGPIMRGMVEAAGYTIIEEDTETLPHSNVIRFQLIP